MPSIAPPPSSLLSARWVQGAFGVGPLALYAVLHLFVGYAALDSRELWIERAHRLALGPIGGVLPVVWMLGHALVCAHQFWERWRAQSLEQRAADPWLAFQVLVSLLFFAFVAGHVGTLWPFGGGSYPGLRSAHDLLWRSLGTPLWLCLYVVGTTAFAFHLGTALARVGEQLTGRQRLSRYVAGIFAFTLWLLFLQVIAHFAIGESLLPGLAPGLEAAALHGAAPQCART